MRRMAAQTRTTAGRVLAHFLSIAEMLNLNFESEARFAGFRLQANIESRFG